MIRVSYIDKGKPAAARFASTLIRSALDATATLRPLFLHCHTKPVCYFITRWTRKVSASWHP